MEESSIFPIDNWYIKVDSENIDLIVKWRLNTFNYNSIISFNKFVYYDGEKGGGWKGEGGRVFFEITTEQFKEFVFNIEPEEPLVIENLDYLELFLKKLNIT